jgi:hypothetical protein
MRIARTTGVASGLLIAVLGIWGALIPFVGAYFNYSFGANETWHYTSDRLWLNVLPGAVALLGGLLLIASTRRASGVVGGGLAVIAGTWFAVGPAVSVTWERGEGPIGRPLFGSTRQMLELVGYFYGLGVLLVALGALAIGRFALPARTVREAPVARAREPAAATPAHGNAATPAATPAASPAAGVPAARRARAALTARRRVPFLRGGRIARAESGAAARGAPVRSDREVPAR